MDDIKIETHPTSGKPTSFYAYEDYTSSLPEITPRSRTYPSVHPWSPFHTLLDFQIAEFMEEIGLNEGQMGCLLTLIQKAVKMPSTFTLVDGKDVRDTWEAGQLMYDTGVCVVL
ncbi:hypothetical protein CC2G_011650 [Coprinopsis cinerea AmutBmut pab1-1]|nr:hypothetical protein CC2G_011650 [Coprinopsis cinerea AmutBmut pab1-1]